MKKHNIALVAHDIRKNELLQWVSYNISTLKEHNLYATGTTGKLISRIPIDVNSGEITTLGDVTSITCLLSGPIGGDSQIGAMISEGRIDMLIFFCDNMATLGHQFDVSALTRLASLHNIAFATNRTTADMILSSPLFSDDSYCPIKPNFNSYLNRQIKHYD